MTPPRVIIVFIVLYSTTTIIRVNKMFYTGRGAEGQGCSCCISWLVRMALDYETLGGRIYAFSVIPVDRPR